MRHVLRNVRAILGFSGPLLAAFGCAMLLPILVAFLCGEDEHNLLTVDAFLAPGLLSIAAGLFFRGVFQVGAPNALQATFVCSLGWLGFSAIGAVPYVIAIDSSFLDGFFEAMSGFTTTGITMYTGLDAMPRSILFWRSLTQLIGGLGILTMFLAVSSAGGGSHQLFGAEGHKIDVDRPVPGLVHTVRVLLAIYLGLTAFIGLLLWVFGMSPFDAVCHSFAALATGGFSPYDASIEYYRLVGHPHYVRLEYVLILGMLFGGMSFVIHFRVLKGDAKALWDNIETRYWWGIIGSLTALILLDRFLRVAPCHESPLHAAFWVRLEEDFRIVLFQVVSVLTTTGFGTRDIASDYFGEAARQLFLVMMVIGGCVGSTGGGVKVLRVAILSKLVRREVRRIRLPAQAITAVIVDGEPVDIDEIQRVGALFFSWMALLVIGGGITEFLSHHTGYQAWSGMFSALGNVGPCFIPYDEMGKLHPIIKIVYIIGMLAGRLEILPVLLLFSRRAWRA